MRRWGQIAGWAVSVSGMAVAVVSASCVAGLRAMKRCDCSTSSAYRRVGYIGIAAAITGTDAAVAYLPHPLRKNSNYVSEVDRITEGRPGESSLPHFTRRGKPSTLIAATAR